MTTEDEGVRIDLSDDAAATGSNMGKNAVSFGVFTQGLEVEIIDRRTLRFVECRPRASDVLNVG